MTGSSEFFADDEARAAGERQIRDLSKSEGWNDLVKPFILREIAEREARLLSGRSRESYGEDCAVRAALQAILNRVAAVEAELIRGRKEEEERMIGR